MSAVALLDNLIAGANAAINGEAFNHETLNQSEKGLIDQANSAQHLQSPHITALNNAIHDGKAGALALKTHIDSISPNSPETAYVDNLNREHNASLFGFNPNQPKPLMPQTPVQGKQQINAKGRSEAHVQGFGFSGNDAQGPSTESDDHDSNNPA